MSSLKKVISIVSLVAVSGFAFGQKSGSYHPIPDVPKQVNNMGHAIAVAQRSVVFCGGNEWNNCYTEVMADEFRKEGRLKTITQKFKKSKELRIGIIELKKLKKSNIDKILEHFRTPIDKTWRENGRIGDGTTEAGQQVEQEICDALVSVIRTELAKKS